MNLVKGILSLLLVVALLGAALSAASQYNATGGASSGISGYAVVAGDNLFRISQRFGTTVDKLMSINGLTSDVIHVGQELKIPGVGGQVATDMPPTRTAPPTWTAQPSLTPQPTPLPTWTPGPSLTPQPSSTPFPVCPTKQIWSKGKDKCVEDNMLVEMENWELVDNPFGVLFWLFIIFLIVLARLLGKKHG